MIRIIHHTDRCETMMEFRVKFLEFFLFFLKISNLYQTMYYYILINLGFSDLVGLAKVAET